MKTEKEIEKELDLCPLTRTCLPNDNELEDFCVLNYESCDKYIEYKNRGWEEKRG